MSRYTGHKRRRRIRLRLLSIDPRCHYCGCPLSVEWSTLDHVIPRSEGGDDDDRNFVLACRRCNGRKGSLPIEMVVVQRHQGCGLLAHKHLLRLQESSRLNGLVSGNLKNVSAYVSAMQAET